MFNEKGGSGMIEKGDLVIKRGKHEAKVYFVEDVNAESILLVNGVRDEYFEGEKDIECFHKQFRLLAKAEHLIEEEKRYRLLSVSPMLRKSECGYLLYHKSMGRYFTGSAEYGGDVYQAIFTESEISQMDITGFEKIRVME
jgi:hypothetical protein